jgi:hypothetical protein
MPRRIRKLIGAVLMLAFVCVYGMAAMLVAQTDHIRYANGVLQAAFFLVVGMSWILPLMPLIKWMERPDAEPLPPPQPR